MEVVAVVSSASGEEVAMVSVGVVAVEEVVGTGLRPGCSLGKNGPPYGLIFGREKYQTN